MKDEPRSYDPSCPILVGTMLVLLSSGVTGTAEGTDVAGGKTSTHELRRTEHSLDLEGNVVPGAYTMEIEVGTPPQTFEVVVDTGSANLFLLGDSSLCDNCSDEVGQALYSPSKSSTAQLSDTNLSVRYGSGSLEAREVSDKVAVEGLSPIDYTFSVMTHQAGIQNILGLAYKAVAQPTGSPLTPYFDQLVSQTGIADRFSMTLCTQGTSRIMFGEADFQPSHYLDLTEEKWYVVRLKSMQVKDGKRLGRFSAPAVVDSGTTNLMVPKRMHGKILKALAPTAKKNGIDLSDELIRTSPEVIDQFPVLQIVAQDANGEKINLDVAPSTYFRTVGTVGYTLAIGIMNTGQVLMGKVFMENYAVVFDRANQRIGLGSNDACQ